MTMNLFRKQKQLKKKKIVKNKLKKCKDKRKLSPLQLLKIEFFNNNVSFSIFDHFLINQKFDFRTKRRLFGQNSNFSILGQYSSGTEMRFFSQNSIFFQFRTKIFVISSSDHNSSLNRKAFLNRNLSFFQFWIKIFDSIKYISVTVIL